MSPKTQASKKRIVRGAKRRSIFITFEGIEGCGKTTQCHRLATLLEREGHSVIETREPGGTSLAEEIRTLLLRNVPKNLPYEPFTPACEAALVLASRSQHITYKIGPALAQGQVVLCDRYSDSTLAYQGYGRGLDIEKLKEFNDLATHGLMPDHTFLFDLPVKQALARRKKARTQNRIDKESLSFHNRVRRGFLALAQRHPNRITVLDGRSRPDVITSEVAAITHTIMTLKLKSRSRKILPRHRALVTA